MEQLIKELLVEIKYELFHYPVTTRKEDVKYLVKRILRPKNTPKRDCFFWTHAMLTQTLENTNELDILVNYYDTWIEKGLPIYNLDNVMNGYSLLYVYDKTQDEKYKQAVDKIYEWICDYLKQVGNPLPYRRNHPTHVYVDGLGMVVPFLCRYGSMFGKTKAMKLGVDQIVLFLKYGMDEKTYLPYHGYDTKTKVKQGIIGWGRAVGWLMLAIADSVEYIPEGMERHKIVDALRKLTQAIMIYLRKDGYFSWQLSAMEGPKDTSATAMIGYALKKIRPYLDMEIDFESIKKAIMASCKNGQIYDCSGECEGFSQYPQKYGSYPWSLGPGLRFLLMD